jgi:hypothetical protein
MTGAGRWRLCGLLRRMRANPWHQEAVRKSDQQVQRRPGPARTVPPEGMDEIGTRRQSTTMNGTRYKTGRRPSPLSVDERAPSQDIPEGSGPARQVCFPYTVARRQTDSNPPIPVYRGAYGNVCSMG